MNIRNENYLGLHELQSLHALQFADSEEPIVQSRKPVPALSTIAYKEEWEKKSAGKNRHAETAQNKKVATDAASESVQEPTIQAEILSEEFKPIDTKEPSDPFDNEPIIDAAGIKTGDEAPPSLPEQSRIDESLSLIEAEELPVAAFTEKEMDNSLLEQIAAESDDLKDSAELSSLLADLESDSIVVETKHQATESDDTVLDTLNSLELGLEAFEPITELMDDDSSLFDELKQSKSIEISNEIIVEDDEQEQEEFEIDDGNAEFDRISLSVLKNQRSFKPIRVNGFDKKQMLFNEKLANKILNQNIDAID